MLSIVFFLLLLFCYLKVVTFQVVLVSNSDRSFILINYGDIAETSQAWLVSGVKARPDSAEFDAFLGQQGRCLE